MVTIGHGQTTSHSMVFDVLADQCRTYSVTVCNRACKGHVAQDNTCVHSNVELRSAGRQREELQSKEWSRILHKIVDVVFEMKVSVTS
jgi:hypothetical protein